MSFTVLCNTLGINVMKDINIAAVATTSVVTMNIKAASKPSRNLTIIIHRMDSMSSVIMNPGREKVNPPAVNVCLTTPPHIN